MVESFTMMFIVRGNGSVVYYYICYDDDYIYGSVTGSLPMTPYTVNELP